ncbi:MAG TPA: response regulator [Pyrinomonadaceae bacterium]|nr:response regulator [Pyrinomonadaceae bacterium]
MTAILVADNDTTWVENLTGIIGGEGGYTVIPAHTPKEAMAIIGRHEADIAILDLRMVRDDDEHDYSGLHVAEDTDRMVPKIIVSAFTSIRDAAESLQIDVEGLPGIVDFVEKQHVKTRLLPSIEKAMKIKRRWLTGAQTTVANQLSQDYDHARAEAQTHYRVSLRLSVLFAIPIVLGAFLLHSHLGSFSVLFAVLGVLVGEVTLHLFNRQLKFLYERVDRFHSELLQSNRFERLLEACFEIKDQKLREEYRVALVNSAIRSWIDPAAIAPNSAEISPTRTSSTKMEPPHLM